MQKIPFLDLKRQYHQIRHEVHQAIDKVLQSAQFTQGPFTKAFERSFAQKHGCRFAVAVNSGTAAIHLGLWALGVGYGDEVIVPTNTFIATAEAVSLTGATPVFVDCEKDYYNIDPLKIEEAITKNTKAIIAVHLYGQPSNVDAILSLCDKHHLFLVEDCAQAHLATYKGKPVGSFGSLGCFSFYPGKNLGSYGEGGAVITNDDALFSKMCMLRNHGSHKKYIHDKVGHNYRIADIQAAILSVKLKHLEKWTEKRKYIAKRYDERLKNIKELVIPKVFPKSSHVYHLYVVQAERRDQLKTYLERQLIECGIHYPISIHRQKAYQMIRKGKSRLLNAEFLEKRILSLPLYPELKEEEQDHVIESIRRFYR